MKILYFDFETTGLDHTKHEPIELAAILLDEQGKELARFEPRLMRVLNPYRPCGEALKVNGKTIDQIMEKGEYPGQVFEDFVKWIRKHANRQSVVLAGHNVQLLDIVKQGF